MFSRHNRVKTPIVLQMEAVECGAASLAIILGYYKRFIPLEELRLACGVSRDGSKASNILKAARQYGFTAKGFRYEPDKLQSMTMPVIIHWNFNHFVVLEGFKKGKAYINDPAVGFRTVSMEQFDKSFTGVVLTFEPDASFRAENRSKSTLASLRSRMTGMKASLLYVALVSFFLMIPGLIIPSFSQMFVDDILIRGQDDWLMPLMAGLALTAAVRGILTWLQQHYLLRMESKLAIGMTGKFLLHVLRLPIAFFAQRQSGDIATRITANDRVARMLSGELATNIVNGVMVVFYLLLMVLYSWKLTMVAVAAAAVNVVLLRWITQTQIEQSMKMQLETGKLFGTLMNGLMQIESIKAGGREAQLFEKLSGHQAKALHAQQSLGVASQSLAAVPPFLALLGQACILCIGGFEIMSGRMSIGMLVAFQFLAQSFSAPLHDLLEMGNRLQEVKADMNRLDDVLDYPVQARRTKADHDGLPAASGTAKLAGEIEFRGVTFGYSRLEPPLVDKLDLKVKAGSRVAIVGSSGSGKSTVAKLMSGLHEPWSGQILFDGVSRGEWNESVVQLSVGIVDQDISMFEGTIRDNITMWDDTVSELDCIRAAKDACIHDDIVVRPGGYDHFLEEGARNFSGGQKQRLEIARALANNPSILILDEATSALDPKTELEIDSRLRRRGCTCVIVAHRLSTIRDCDEIVVLERGKVVQRGTHDSLKDADGLYAKLIGQS